MHDMIKTQIEELKEKLNSLEEKREYLDSIDRSVFQVSNEIEECKTKIAGLEKLLSKDASLCA